jgi:hypothetical protein
MINLIRVGSLGFVALSLLFAKSSLAQTDGSVSHFIPLPPGELIKFLPVAPDPWKTTLSRASNQLSSWLLTIAQKSIEYTPPPAQKGQPPVTMKMSMTLMDGGGQPLSGQFENFKPGVSGNQENVMINGCPTVINRESDVRERAVMSISNRFTFTLVAENQPVGTAKKWAAALDVGRLTLAGKASAAAATLPSEIQIDLVDELNPKNNRHVVQQVRQNPPGR